MKRIIIRKVLFTCFILFLTFFALTSGCDLQSPSAPNWYVDANLPFLDKVHTIFDLLKNEHNIGYDENANAFFSDASHQAEKYQNLIHFNGSGDINLNIPTILNDSIISTAFDDSTFITSLYFESSNPPATLSLIFNPSPTLTTYTINITVLNLINGGTPLTISRTISDRKITENIDITTYSIQNPIPSNQIIVQIKTFSANYEFVNFTYNVSPFFVKSATGRLRPLKISPKDTLLVKPFGKHDLSGSLDFSNINPAKTYIVVKRSKSTFQTDIKDIRYRGINNNGTVVDFKYLRYDTIGAPLQPIDSIFNLRLSEGIDSAVYYVNQYNSNIIEFIRNIPENIHYVRNIGLNQNYSTGTFVTPDSISFYLNIEVPFTFSITDPLTYQDTIIKKITDTLAIKRLKTTDKVDATMYLRNSLPLMASVRMYVVDSLNNLLFTLTQLLNNNNNADSVLLQAAPVDNNGYVLNYVDHTFTGVIDSLQVRQLLQMRKIIYQYRLYTDPNQIPTIDGKVRIRGSDYIKQTSFGTFRYLIANH